MKRIFMVTAPLMTLFVHFWVKFRLVHLHVKGLGSDPCDAVNVATVLVTFLVVLRAFALLISSSSADHKDRVGLRSAMTIVLAISLSLTAECIALIQHSAPLQAGSRSIPLLFACEWTVTGLALWTLSGSRFWSWSLAGIWLSAVCILFFCPEWPGQRDTHLWHFTTSAIGFILLLVFVRSALFILATASESLRGQTLSAIDMAVAACGAVLIGCGFFAAKNPRSMLMLGILGVLFLAYAALASPLEVRFERSTHK